jgi:hypothetical protein
MIPHSKITPLKQQAGTKVTPLNIIGIHGTEENQDS